MNEDLVVEIMAAEEKATQIRKDAERQADRVIAEAKDAADAQREAVWQRARAQADEIVARGEEVAAQERQKLIAEAREAAEAFRDQAQEHFEAGVAYVVAQVLGREA